MAMESRIECEKKISKISDALNGVVGSKEQIIMLRSRINTLVDDYVGMEPDMSPGSGKEPGANGVVNKIIAMAKEINIIVQEINEALDRL